MRAFKLGAILITAALVCIATAVLPPKLIFKGGENYTFFVGDTSRNYQAVTPEGDAALYKLTLKNIGGESATYSSLDPEKFVSDMGGKIEFVEELSDSVNYYCSAPLPYSVTLYDKQINLHICVKKDGVTVASPIIFGGY